MFNVLEVVCLSAPETSPSSRALYGLLLLIAAIQAASAKLWASATIGLPLIGRSRLSPLMTHFDRLVTDKTETITVATSLTRFAARGRNVAREAFWAKRLVRLCFVKPKRSTELVFVTPKAELLSKFAVLILEFQS